MRAGRLRHRITIQQLVAGSPDQRGTGEPDEAWTDVTTVWGAVEPLQGRALWAAQERHAEVSVSVRIRYLAGVTAKMRVVFENRYYEIEAVIDNRERHVEMELLCREGVSDG